MVVDTRYSFSTIIPNGRTQEEGRSGKPNLICNLDKIKVRQLCIYIIQALTWCRKTGKLKAITTNTGNSKGHNKI